MIHQKLLDSGRGDMRSLSYELQIAAVYAVGAMADGRWRLVEVDAMVVLRLLCERRVVGDRGIDQLARWWQVKSGKVSAVGRRKVGCEQGCRAQDAVCG